MHQRRPTKFDPHEDSSTNDILYHIQTRKSSAKLAYNINGVNKNRSNVNQENYEKTN